jgi:hypothetical protein
MRRLILFFATVLSAVSLLCSCHTGDIVGGYYGELNKVEIMFNGKVVMTETVKGSDYFQDGVRYLNRYVIHAIKQGDDALGHNEYVWDRVPVVNPKSEYELLSTSKKKDTIWLCYFTTDKTKKENCDWDDNYQGASIYKDKDGYYYRFGDDGTAVQLALTQDSKGNWVYWDSLVAYYKYVGEYDSDLDI